LANWGRVDIGNCEPDVTSGVLLGKRRKGLCSGCDVARIDRRKWWW
jgi:hypothetical protein